MKVIPLQWANSPRARGAYDALVYGDHAVCTPEAAARVVVDLERAHNRGDEQTLCKTMATLLGRQDVVEIASWLNYLGYPADNSQPCASYPSCQNVITPRQHVSVSADGRVWCAQCAHSEVH